MQSYLKGNAVEDVLRKKYFRVPSSIPGGSIPQEENSSIQFGHQLFADDLIPKKIPIITNFNADTIISGNDVINTYYSSSGITVDGGGDGDVVSIHRDQFNELEKWEKLVLKPLPRGSSFQGTIATTFTRFSIQDEDGKQDVNSDCLLTNIIPSNYAVNNPDYKYKLYINDVEIPPANEVYKWYLDTGTGLVTFYGKIPRGTVKLSFTRYIGSKGIESLSLSQFENVVDEFAIRHKIDEDLSMSFPSTVEDGDDTDSKVVFDETGGETDGLVRILINEYDYGKYNITLNTYNTVVDSSNNPSFIFSQNDNSFVDLSDIFLDSTDISDVADINSEFATGVDNNHKGALIKIFFPSIIRLQDGDAENEKAITITVQNSGSSSGDVSGIRDAVVYGLNKQNRWIEIGDQTDNTGTGANFELSIDGTNPKRNEELRGVAIIIKSLNVTDSDSGVEGKYSLKLHKLRFHGYPVTKVSQVFDRDKTILGITESQKIGFGKFNPEYNLDVSGDMGVDGSLNVAGNYFVDGFMDLSGDMGISGNVLVREGGRIDVSGDMGVDGSLNVVGNVDISNGNIILLNPSADIIFINESGGKTTLKDRVIQLSGDEQERILDDSLRVTQDLTVQGDLVNTSDKRLKNNIITIGERNALNKIMKMRGVYYDMNEQKNVGLIAQEVLEILPEVVVEMNNGYYGVKYGNIVGLLVEGFKDQERRLREVERKLEELSDGK